MKPSRLKFSPIEALMLGWTILAFVLIPLWDSTWKGPVLVVALLVAWIVGAIFEPRERLLDLPPGLRSNGL